MCVQDLNFDYVTSSKYVKKVDLKLPKNDLVSGRGNVLNDSKFKVKNKWIIFNTNSCMIGSFP